MTSCIEVLWSDIESLTVNSEANNQSFLTDSSFNFERYESSSQGSYILQWLHELHQLHMVENPKAINKDHLKPLLYFIQSKAGTDKNLKSRKGLRQSISNVRQISLISESNYNVTAALQKQ